MRKGPNVCPRECPRRSAECRLTCPEWKEFEAQKQAEYAARAVAYHAYPDSQRKNACMRKNARDNLKRK